MRLRKSNKKVAIVPLVRQVKPFGYKVSIDHRCVSYERDHEGAFANWSKSFINTLNNLVTKEDKSPDVVSIHDFQPGTNALVVWAEWNSGNSFGCADNGGIEAIGIFKDITSAKQLADHIHSQYNNHDVSYSIVCADGQEFSSIGAPWLGMFEHLTNVRIDVVTIF